MEIGGNKHEVDISSLKEEINANEAIIDNYLKAAHNMKWMALGTVILSIFMFSVGSIPSGFIALFLAFLCIRKYNRSMGMAEVYFGVTKFLKFVLQREITGDTSYPEFLN